MAEWLGQFRSNLESYVSRQRSTPHDDFTPGEYGEELALTYKGNGGNP
jgi:hypothetical protein